MGDKQPKPNDQRADVKNPNNPAHEDAANNRSRQRNPQDPKYEGPSEPQPPPAKKP